MDLTLFLNILLASLAMAADGMCIRATDGMQEPQRKKEKALRIVFSFGLFQMRMPAIGDAVSQPFEAMRKADIP